VLMRSDPADIAAAIRLSRQVIRNIRQNLFWAFFYNAVCIPLAAGAFYPAFGLALNPMIAAGAMSLSSVFVVTNALRLNTVRVHDASHDRPLRANRAKRKPAAAECTLFVQGMMCENCERHVSDALRALAPGASAHADFRAGTVAFSAPAPVKEKKIRRAVTAAGYVLTKIEYKTKE